MVAMVEIAFLVVCLSVGVWWVSRSSRFRSRHTSAADAHTDGGTDTKVDPPNHGFDPGTGGSW